MKKLLRIVRTSLTMCRNCWGMKVIELPNGDTKSCPACNGKGFTE